MSVQSGHTPQIRLAAARRAYEAERELSAARKAVQAVRA